MTDRFNIDDYEMYLSCFANSALLRGAVTDESYFDVMDIAYVTTLLGEDADLAMHGGGNTSVKITVENEGELVPALCVKASGTPLDEVAPDDFVVLDLNFLESLKSRNGIDDDAMAQEFKACQLLPNKKLPSVETLMHGFCGAKFVAHTHPAAILKLANRTDGDALLKKCFGDELAVIPFAKMGFDLAKATSAATREFPKCAGVIIRHHGIVVWGGDAEDVYHKTIDYATRAEKFLSDITTRKISAQKTAPKKNAASVPMPEKTFCVILNTRDVMQLINSQEGKKIICDPPLTPDYPMYYRITLSWADARDLSDKNADDQSDKNTVDRSCENTNADTHINIDIDDIDINKLPLAIVYPPIGVLCYAADEASAQKCADYVRQAFAIRRAIFETGGEYEPLNEEFVQNMYYRTYGNKPRENYTMSG